VSGQKERRKLINVTDLKAERNTTMSNLLLMALVALTGYTSTQISSINKKVGSIDVTTQLNGQAINTIEDRIEKHELADNKKFDEFNDFIRQYRK